MIKERNIVTCILLTIVTCGIYSIFWMISITEDVDMISKNPNRRNGGVVILLMIVTCGLYSLYWWYQNGKLMEEANETHDVAGSSNSVLYLVLSLIQLAIVNYCLVQSDINKYANNQVNIA